MLLLEWLMEQCNHPAQGRACVSSTMPRPTCQEGSQSHIPRVSVCVRVCSGSHMFCLHQVSAER